MTLTTRAALPEDYEAFARLFPALEVPEPTPSRERFSAGIQPESLVAVLDGVVVGIVWSRTRGDALHVVYLITDATARRRGVGRQLMAAAAARARALGRSRWMLNVKPENVAARALYAACGMAERFASVSLRFTWQDLALLPSPPTDLAMGPLREEAPVERALGFGAGELGALRTLPGRTFLCALRGDEPVGVIGFDPTMPGAYPLRARTPALARALLEAVRPPATADTAHVYAYVDDDVALEHALRDAGAQVVLRTLRMDGAVPPG